MISPNFRHALASAALLTIAAAAVASAQKAPTPPPSPLASAKVLACSFPAFGSARWDTATPQVLSGSQEFSFNVDLIDYKRRQARIVAAGTALASLLMTPTGMNVIEQTPAGNVTLTSIFSGGNQGKTYLAVHARHLGEPDGPPRTSQAYGSCLLEQ